MMESSMLVTFILIVAIAWTETVAKRCPSHCKCDYQGSSYCSVANSIVTLSLKDLGFSYSSLSIDCSGINFGCSDLPELETFEVYSLTSNSCSPRILRCLKYILGDVQIATVFINNPTKALVKEDVTDLTDVETLWLHLTDDMVINSDAIYGWPSLSEVYLIGGTLQLSPNNNITNNALKHISLRSTKLCSLPDGAFNGITNLNSFTVTSFEDSPQESKLCHYDIHIGAFKGVAELQELFLENVKSIEPGTFADTRKLANLHITGPLKSIPNGVVEGMSSLYEIRIACNGSEIVFGTHAFSQNVALDTVDVIKCKLNSLSDQLFSNSDNIISINIEDGGIKNLSPNIFSHLSALKYIILDGNGIDELPDEVFNNLTSLKSIQLGNNGITQLQDNAFRNLFSLTDLQLNNNKIQDLTEIIFSNLTSLKLLWLHNNKIKKLPEGIFTNLGQLIQLHLDNNNIHELPDGSFASLSSLIILSLAQNYLTKLHENSFTNLTSLRQLDLSNNNLEELPNKIFSTLTSLEDLILHTNKIRELPDFSSLTSLTKLDLSNNLIVRLYHESFYKLHNLKLLRLRNNTINKLEAFHHYSNIVSYPPGYPTSPFHPLKKLDELDLSFNNLRQLYKGWQHDLRHVRELTLSHNRLSISQEFQADFSDMKINIYLDNNEITEVILDPRGPFSNDTPSIWASSIVILNNNPIVCDCNTYGLLRRVKGDRLSHEPLYYNPYVGGEKNDIICAAPPNLNGFRLKDVKAEQLVCDLSQHLPDNCSSYTAIAVTNEVILSCPQMPSTWIDIEANDFPYVFFEQPTVTLYLENQPESIEHLNIHTLNLSNAKIHEIAFAPTDSLTVLDLSHNNLVSIPDQFLNTNITLYLSGNPLFCDCLLVRKFNNMTTLADAASIMCINEGKLKDINEDELCHRLQSLTSVIAISAVCGVLVIMVTVPLCKYIKRKWTNISKIFFCSRRHSSRSIELSRTKMHKQFDLYITFTYRDEEFVRENLLPKLQFEFNQKICVHYRDGTDEDLVPEQIIESVDNSEKTVIILTDSFLKSSSTFLAFSRAHSLAKNDHESKIIIILLNEDITQNERINDDLKPYLTTNSSLLWGDPNFWTLLQDILPKNNKLISD